MSRHLNHSRHRMRKFTRSSVSSPGAVRNLPMLKKSFRECLLRATPDARTSTQFVSGWKRLQMHLEQCESVRVQGGCLRRLHYLPHQWQHPQQQQRPPPASSTSAGPGYPSDVSTKSPLLLGHIGIFCRE